MGACPPPPTPAAPHRCPLPHPLPHQVVAQVLEQHHSVHEFHVVQHAARHGRVLGRMGGGGGGTAGDGWGQAGRMYRRWANSPSVPAQHSTHDGRPSSSSSRAATPCSPHLVARPVGEEDALVEERLVPPVFRFHAIDDLVQQVGGCLGGPAAGGGGASQTSARGAWAWAGGSPRPGSPRPPTTTPGPAAAQQAAAPLRHSAAAHLETVADALHTGQTEHSLLCGLT